MTDIPDSTQRLMSLLGAVERVSAASTMEGVIAAVCETARAVCGADGVSVVLREGDECHYVDENAVGPLWKGRRFALTASICGWCMLNDQLAIIPDIYADARIPHDVYRPTFVKSLVMVPVRAGTPVAAIGFYWSTVREFDADVIAFIEALARSTSAAIVAVQARERIARLQSALAHTGRLNEMEQMVSAFAHELNQPLTAANNYLRAAKRYLETGASAERIPELIGKADDQITRTTQIIKRIRGFAGKKEPNQTDEALAPLIGDAVELALMDPSHRGIDVQIEIPKDLPSARVDRVGIQQVLLNLLRNAFEAMEKSALRRVVIAASMDGCMIEISVNDTGPGLAPEIAAKLFQPFVTTKDGGMGVGLSISRAIVEAHGGRMWNAPGSGADFHFTLPAAL